MAETVDLEVGGPAIIGPLWLHRLTSEPKTHHTILWYKVGTITGLICLPFFYGLLSKHETYIRQNIPFFPLFLLFSVNLTYIAFLLYVTLGREPYPHPSYALPRSHKLSIESAFVVACSCWTLFERDGDIFTAILGLVLLFKLIPVVNLWWEFENFDSWDCYVFVFVDAALVCCRYLGGAALMVVVACLGVALHFCKDLYRHRKEIEIDETKKQLLVECMERAYLWARSLTSYGYRLYEYGRWCDGVDEQGLTQILF